MASSSSSSFCNWVYDVFPSFSGEDVRITFLSHFLKELDRKLIISFKDNEIKRSQSLDPALKQAIRTSRIAIVVFSEKYPSSSWCMDEFMEIVKCSKESGQLVIPIFYVLDPSHVRKQTGKFGDAFDTTCERKTKEETKLLRESLTEVANIVGYHSHKWYSEAKMIEAIVNDVLSKLEITPPEDFEDFVGMEDHIAKMSVLLDLESEEVRMVGIWGTSGIGKTSIARVLYSRLCHHFQATIFIDRAFVSRSTKIYKNSNSDDYNKKLHLLRSFLSAVLGKKDIQIDGLSAMGGRLKNKKVLIFIDDLDEQMVLDTLAGQIQWFGCGSRIIVVTKDKQFLRSHGIDCIYELSLPSTKLALDILCIYVFKKNAPPEDINDLVFEVAFLAGYLPLGLKILGSYLRAIDKDDWMDMLPRLRNSLDGKIEKTLRLSYDGLNNRKDQAIFCHIACLFNGEKLNNIKLLLADSDLDVNIGLKNLVDKSLIHVRDDIVDMHCLLEEMGKEIVRAQSNEPRERQFLVDSKDICDLFEHSTGTKSVLGITLDMDKVDELHIHENAFKGMRNLFFLNLYSKKMQVRWHLFEGLEYFPSKLRLLRFDGYPMKHMPSNFRPENLVKLEMEGSKLEKLWDGVHILNGLKKLNLSRSKNLKEILDFSKATNISEVYLEDCSSLVELPSSIQYLNKLEKLIMSGCTNLETLHTGINLQSLEMLQLNRCSKLKNFPDISTNLKEIYLRDCSSIVELPSFIEYLSKLEKLMMLGCTNLEILPTGINLQSLEILELSKCSKLKGFPDISTNIFQRHLNETSIEKFPSTLCLKKLRELEIWRLKTEKLEKWRIETENFWDIMKPLGPLSLFLSYNHALQRLQLSDIPSLVELPPSIQNFYGLEDLEIINCINLETLSSGINLRYLNSLNLNGCSQLKTFPNISTNIRFLWLEQTGIEEVPCWIGIFSKLRYLKMMKCNNLRSVSLNIYKLRLEVDFSDCKALTETSWNGSQIELAMAIQWQYERDFFYKLVNLDLDPEAVLNNRSIIFTIMQLSSEELPSYFTHQTTGNSLNNIPLHQTFLAQPFLRLRIGAVVFLHSHFPVYFYVSFQFKSKFGNSFGFLGQPYRFYETEKGKNLCILDCRIPLSKDNAPLPELSYDHVDIQIYIENRFSKKTRFTVKGWGIRILEDYSSEKERLLNPNSLPVVCETNEGYMIDKTEHTAESRDNNVETEKISKRMRTR